MDGDGRGGVWGVGLGGPLSLLEETRPVADAVEEVAGMDEVDGLGFEEPVFFCVVDFEGEVWWDPGMIRGVGGGETRGSPLGLYRTWEG